MQTGVLPRLHVLPIMPFPHHEPIQYSKKTSISCVKALKPVYVL
jgi:hypothetical protein